VQGSWRFILGLGSKVLIADPMAAVATHVFSQKPYEISVGYTWLGTIAYTMQIYFDFAGYSSMAIGLALMVGFRFPENFNHPYLAISVTDFWRRWHMSLSRWMRDYLYIPLGGNRVSPARQKINLWIVFLISGFWHGAEWTFIMWGVFHGFFLAFERTSLGHRYLSLPPFLRRPFTFITVMFGWVLFRSETLSDAIARWGRMLGCGEATPLVPRFSIISDVGVIVLSIALVWCLLIEPLIERRGENPAERQPLYESYPLLYPTLVVIALLSILFIEAGRYSPFIYFQF
jgi:alginate O-acetyltransferase complex protein AlgI